MTDLTLFPEYPNLVKIPLVEEEKQSSILVMPIQMKGNPKHVLAPLLNG